MGPRVNWAAANGGVTNGGLRGVWSPFLEIGRNRPFSPFSCHFRPFPEGPRSTWEIQKTEEKGLFPQISSDFLKPPSLKPPFAALQVKCRGNRPEKHAEHAKQLSFGCLAVIPAVFRLFSRHFARHPLGTLFGCFFRLFSFQWTNAPLQTIPLSSRAILEK